MSAPLRGVAVVALVDDEFFPDSGRTKRLSQSLGCRRLCRRFTNVFALRRTKPRSNAGGPSRRLQNVEPIPVIVDDAYWSDNCANLQQGVIWSVQHSRTDDDARVFCVFNVSLNACLRKQIVDNGRLCLLSTGYVKSPWCPNAAISRHRQHSPGVILRSKRSFNRTSAPTIKMTSASSTPTMFEFMM